MSPSSLSPARASPPPIGPPDLLHQQRTTASGRYTMSGLSPGTYRVRFESDRRLLGDAIFGCYSTSNYSANGLRIRRARGCQTRDGDRRGDGRAADGAVTSPGRSRDGYRHLGPARGRCACTSPMPGATTETSPARAASTTELLPPGRTRSRSAPRTDARQASFPRYPPRPPRAQLLERQDQRGDRKHSSAGPRQDATGISGRVKPLATTNPSQVPSPPTPVNRPPAPRRPTRPRSPVPARTLRCGSPVEAVHAPAPSRRLHGRRTRLQGQGHCPPPWGRARCHARSELPLHCPCRAPGSGPGPAHPRGPAAAPPPWRAPGAGEGRRRHAARRMRGRTSASRCGAGDESGRVRRTARSRWSTGPRPSPAADSCSWTSRGAGSAARTCTRAYTPTRWPG